MAANGAGKKGVYPKGLVLGRKSQEQMRARTEQERSESYSQSLSLSDNQHALQTTARDELISSKLKFYPDSTTKTSGFLL